MSRRAGNQRYIVVGPGIIDGEEPSYADPGPAMSRTLTCAQKSDVDGTWYARDAVTDENYAYTVREQEGKSIHTHRTGKGVK